MIPIYGLYYYYNLQVVSLPLLNVRAEASIKELAAQVKLTQTYGNDSSLAIEATYSFPIPARAAVCSFVMIKQNGTRVVGRVEEKEEARQAYDAAVSQGQQASLMEQQTPDVFKVSVGNIPPKEQVQVELVYATELSEDEESDSARFHLPVHIGARYGQAPKSPSKTSLFTKTVFLPSANTPFLSLLMSVEAIAPIAKIGCPSHSVSTELGPDPKLPNFKELPFSNYARVSLSSNSALDKDFVLTIKSAGLDAPRCVAELHPSHNTVALGLTLVPRFKLPDLSRQEFVFLVDRSGSMKDMRIAAARKALVVMLRALPHKDSLFQIVSFGNRSTSLWASGSRPYNQDTLEEATRHVDGMSADYGGTKIRGALQMCFKGRRLDRPTSVLILTDGDAWDLDGVLTEVKDAVARAPQNAYLRVSVLGIGNSASTAMCEGIARVGNGTCMMVGEEETTFTGKIARLLKAARTPLISNISVDWGRPAAQQKALEKLPDYDDDFEMVDQSSEKKAKKLNIFDESDDDPISISSAPAPPPPAVVLRPPPIVQQAPFKIRNLFPNIRLNVYAILQGKDIPKTVTIRGSTADGSEIELPITVALSHLQNAPDAPPAIHALAARKIIQDLEDGQHALVETLVNADDTDLLARTVKASIVRLGKTYSISSAHTSFVAIDESGSKVVAPGICVAPLPVHGFAPAIRHKSIAPPTGSFMRYRLAPAGSLSTGFAGSGSSIHYSGMNAPSPPERERERSRESKPPPPKRSKPKSRPFSTAYGQSHVQADLLGGFALSAPAAPPAPARPSAAPSFAPGGYGGGGSLLDADDGWDAGRGGSTSSSFFGMKKKVSSFHPKQAAPALFGAASSKLARTQAPLQPTVAKQSRNRSRDLAAGGLDADPVEALARLQSFDGHFSLDVLTIVKLKAGIESVRKAFPSGVPDAIVATVLAMAFLSTKLGAGVDRDSWEGIYEKAQQYVEAALQDLGATGVTALEAKVATMLA